MTEAEGLAMTPTVFARSVSDEAISLGIGLGHHEVTQRVNLLNLRSGIKRPCLTLTTG